MGQHACVRLPQSPVSVNQQSVFAAAGANLIVRHAQKPPPKAFASKINSPPVGEQQISSNKYRPASDRERQTHVDLNFNHTDGYF